MQLIKRIFFSFLACILACTFAWAQELNCKVTINSDKIQGTNKSIFTTLEKAITEFVNEKQWTSYNYQVEERIDCSFYIIVNSFSAGTFSCELQVSATRPVFNSSYKSPIFSYNDKNLAFNYNENDPLTYDETSFGNNLTEVLAFYAYIIIATDCDSFSRYGGDEFYRKAENIVNQAQSTNELGWRAFEDDRNRYALINTLLDDLIKPYRDFFYIYHRQGLDEMSVSAPKSRTKIIENLPTLKSIYKARPSTIIINEFVETKADELVNVLSTATREEKKTAYDILVYVSPTLQYKFDALK